MSRLPGLPALCLALGLALGAGGCAEDGPSPPAGEAAAPGTADPTSDGSGSPAADTAPPPAVDPVVVPHEGGPPVDPPRADVRPRSGLPRPVALPGEGERPRFERPEHVRGLYLNAWTAGSARRLEQLVDLARRTEINSFVIDIKDATGFVSHATGVEEARSVGAAGQLRIADLPGLLRRLEAEGIYPIARIVIVKDPILAEVRPDWAVQDTAGGVWEDGKGIRWLNLFDERVHDYHIALAREVVELGFPEVQWDYVRFPDAPRSEIARARYPGRDGRPRTAATRLFLERSRRELGGLGAVVTADVFGVTTSAGDVGIGQVWEDFIDVVDVALPMVYPSHYWRGSFGIERPNARPYEIVRYALRRAVERSAAVEGAGTTRPWLQDFSLGSPDYGAPEVRAQIQATYDVGIREWILWNASSRYTAEALEPAGGWREEPLIRIADRVVPVSERHEALRLASAAAGAGPEPGGADDPPAEGREAAGGGVGGKIRVLDADSLRRAVDSILARDTLEAEPDTTSGG